MYYKVHKDKSTYTKIPKKHLKKSPVYLEFQVLRFAKNIECPMLV